MSFIHQAHESLVLLVGAERVEIAARLLLSLLLGGIVGVERERKHQPAGFRTHVVLCLGATLMMLTSIHMGETFTGPAGPGQPAMRVSDPSRIAAQVVSGVGFLGGGAILRMGVTIRGLTTAASLWTTAGIGLAAGCGFYWGAIFCTLLMFTVLGQLSKIEQVLLRSKTVRSLLVSARDIPGLIGSVERVLTCEGMKVLSLRVTKSSPEGTVDLVASVEVPVEADTSRVVKELAVISEIQEVDLQ